MTEDHAGDQQRLRGDRTHHQQHQAEQDGRAGRHDLTTPDVAEVHGGSEVRVVLAEGALDLVEPALFAVGQNGGNSREAFIRILAWGVTDPGSFHRPGYRGASSLPTESHPQSPPLMSDRSGRPAHLRPVPVARTR
jgi:hypothetical protein